MSRIQTVQNTESPNWLHLVDTPVEEGTKGLKLGPKWKEKTQFMLHI